MRTVLPCLLLLLMAIAVGADPARTRPEVFTDERAVVTMPADGRVAFTQRLLTANGWGATHQGEAEVVDGRTGIQPLGEGINIVAFAGVDEVRFLAVAPPPPLDRGALLAALPKTGAKLLAGEPYSILAMGDSVTNTGDYAGMFARQLARATGNTRITITNRSYPGRSADATARKFDQDLAAAGRPDLGLLMYGLNDQVCFVPQEALLEHYRFVAEGLAARSADTVFLQPTPHFDIPLSESERKPDSPPPWSAFRTIGFAEALRPLASELRVPLAETFSAVWGDGGDGLIPSVRAMWPRYPRSYDRQLSSMIESDGKGDDIHPNALGHLAMARACLAALGPPPAADPLVFSGTSRWDADGVHSTLTVTNRGETERAGRIEVYPQLRGELQVERPVAYRLAPGASTVIEVGWPQARIPEDLLRFPNERYLAPGRPTIPLLDISDGRCRVRAVTAPFVVRASFVRERSVCNTPVADVTLTTATGAEKIAIPFPADDVGRVPLMRKVEAGGVGWAVAELAYVRFAGAVRGEVAVDGDLDEWTAQVWSPVGKPCQARFSCGPEDHRASPEECSLEWSSRAGAQRMYVAMRVRGEVAKDGFVVFLDPREPQLLGKVGRYYWLNGALKTDGKVAVARGETTGRDVELQGRWRSAEGCTTIELAIPYAAIDREAWPASGDLGLSLWWTHRGADGRATNLLWSEDGHPWNPRWYGVVRLQEQPDAASLPWMVRVR
jgi:lysophospholipase L1-like esterase